MLFAPTPLVSVPIVILDGGFECSQSHSPRHQLLKGDARSKTLSGSEASAGWRAAEVDLLLVAFGGSTPDGALREGIQSRACHRDHRIHVDT